MATHWAVFILIARAFETDVSRVLYRQHGLGNQADRIPFIVGAVSNTAHSSGKQIGCIEWKYIPIFHKVCVLVGTVAAVIYSVPYCVYSKH